MVKHKHILYGYFTPSSIPPRIITWLIERGFVKKEWQAILLLFIVIAGCIILTVYNLLCMQEIWSFFDNI